MQQAGMAGDLKTPGGHIETLPEPPSPANVKVSNLICGAMRMAALAASIAAGFGCEHVIFAAPLPSIPVPQAGSRWHESSLDDYRKHLVALATLVESCARARDLKNCDPLLVGQDDRIPLGSGLHVERRLVRYGWLRVLFSKAEEPDEPVIEVKRSSADPASAQPPQPTTSQLLQDAEKRLAGDLAQTDTNPLPEPSHKSIRNTMEQVLAGNDFRNLKQPSVEDTVMEKVNNWLNRLFESAARFRTQSAWVGRLLVWGFILAVCVGLVWALLQLERRWRVRLVPDDAGPVTGAASARDWQLWLEDARRAAAAGLWREAIHFVYWASISRLESRRLWPADRARTPREYLALVAPDDPRKASLARLTGSFELTWYGGRTAAERDYRQAEDLAKGLIAGTAATEGGGA